MKNAKKIIENSKSDFTEVKRERTRKIKIDLDTLDDAIVDGKLMVAIKGRVVFERQFYKRIEVHEGFVVSISDKGIVELHDETRSQCYAFDLAQPQLRIKSLFPIEKKLVGQTSDATKASGEAQ